MAECPRCHLPNADTSRFCSECGAPLTPTPTPSESIPARTMTYETPLDALTTGSTFAGRYQIVEELGGGGMGRVYRAIDKKLNEEVALKLIKPEIAQDKRTLERFHNELKLARKISHRHVGRVYELMEDQDRHFITMEYVAGQDLRALIRQTGQLTVSKAVAITAQVAEGLAEAHRLGVVHRDLKPSNIIIDRQGNARIMDFGIARSAGTRGTTKEGAVIGTPEYMSPEQVDGKPADDRSDIYSLGVVLYEMVTGRVPFEGETPLSVGVKQRTHRPADPRGINPQVPHDLDQLILKCLEKDPARRFASAEEVQAELLRIGKTLPTTERSATKKKTTTPREITVKFEPRKVLWPAVGIAAGMLAIWAVIRFLPKKPPAPAPTGKPTLAVLYFENISGDKDLDAWKTGLTELLITKLSQSRFIHVLDGNTTYSLLKRLNLDEAKKYTKEDLQRVAAAGGSNYTLSGSLMKAGQDIVISMSLQHAASGEVISPISLECKSEEEIITGVDEVAGKIKADLNLSSEQIASDHDKEVSQTTTRSAEAFKLYSEGRKLHLQEQYQKSIDLMKKAIALDPEFAMAYRSMASAYGNQGQPDEARANYGKAFEYRDRVSDRERHVIEGDYYRLSERTYGQAVKAYRALLDIYPDDGIANTNLGVLYTNLEEYDKAIACYQAALKGNASLVYGNLVECYQAKGELEKAREVLQDYLSRVGDSPGVRNRLAQNYVLEGRSDLALEEIDRALALHPDSTDLRFTRINILFLRDNLAEAEAELSRLLKSGDSGQVMMVRLNLALLYAYQGRMAKVVDELGAGLKMARKIGEPQAIISMLMPFSYVNRTKGSYAEALGQLEEAKRLAAKVDDPGLERGLLYSRGLTEVAAKSLDRAERTALELKGLCEQAANRKEIRSYLGLRGAIELERKNYAAAIESLGQALSRTSFAWSKGWDTDAMAALAEAYYRSGDKKKALEQYQIIVSSPLARRNNVLGYVAAFYEMGKICQEMGLKDRARENFSKFLDIRKNSDPGLPQVEDAKKRLAALSVI